MLEAIVKIQVWDLDSEIILELPLWLTAEMYVKHEII